MHEMLMQRCGDRVPDETDLMAVLAAMGPPESYTLDTPSTGGLLQLLLMRVWIGHPRNLAVNDDGRRRVYWGRLVMFFLMMNLLGVGVLLAMGWMIDSWAYFARWTALVVFVGMNVGIAIGFYRNLGRVPVTDLPGIETGR